MEAAGGCACGAVDGAIAVPRRGREPVQPVEGVVCVTVDAAEGLADQGDHRVTLRERVRVATIPGRDVALARALQSSASRAARAALPTVLARRSRTCRHECAAACRDVDAFEEEELATRDWPLCC